MHQTACFAVVKDQDLLKNRKLFCYQVASENKNSQIALVRPIFVKGIKRMK